MIHLRQLISLSVIIIAMFIGAIKQTDAHGGFELRMGEVTAYVSQTPISPLVGENISIAVVFKRSLNEPLVNVPVSVKVIDTFPGDESKDKLLTDYKYVTDENGAIEFSQQFSKENYFDIELTFVDPKTGKEVSTGFLIQPRAIPNVGSVTPSTSNIQYILVSGLVGLIIGMVGYKVAVLFSQRSRS